MHSISQVMSPTLASMPLVKHNTQCDNQARKPSRRAVRWTAKDTVSLSPHTAIPRVVICDVEHQDPFRCSFAVADGICLTNRRPSRQGAEALPNSNPLTLVS